MENLHLFKLNTPKLEPVITPKNITNNNRKYLKIALTVLATAVAVGFFALRKSPVVSTSNNSETNETAYALTLAPFKTFVSVANETQVRTNTTNIIRPTAPINPSANISSELKITVQKQAFIDECVAKKMCPNLKDYITHQRENKYLGWDLDSFKKLFSDARDLSAEEARFSLYEDFKKHIDLIAKNHPDAAGKTNCSQYPKSVARDISNFRDSLRDYTRTRSWRVVQQYLDYIEPRTKGFDFYWKKYHNNTCEIIEGAKKSNPGFGKGLTQTIDFALDQTVNHPIRNRFAAAAPVISYIGFKALQYAIWPPLRRFNKA